MERNGKSLGELPIISIDNPTLAHFRHFSSLFTPSSLYICRGSSTNQLLFMQNKPNVKYAQINVNSYMKSKYEKLDTWLSGKNKPNSNPIKPNLQKAKMNVNLTLTKDYRKKDDFLVRINKPNFQNGQNERKLNFNKGLQKKRLFSTPKNKPKTNPISSKAKMNLKALNIACRKIRPHHTANHGSFLLALNRNMVNNSR